MPQHVQMLHFPITALCFNCYFIGLDRTSSRRRAHGRLDFPPGFGYGVNVVDLISP